MTSYSQRIFNGQKPVFDGRKNLYSREPLPIARDRVGIKIYHNFNYISISTIFAQYKFC